MPEIEIMFVIGIPTLSADDLENIDDNLQKEIEDLKLQRMNNHVDLGLYPCGVYLLVEVYDIAT